MSNRNILMNSYTFGAYKLAYVPLEELYMDMSYQRITSGTVTKLVKNWNDEECDPLLINYRGDEDKFYIIDGGHRVSAARMLKMQELPCRILVNKSPKEEATIFAQQNKCKAPLKVFDKYKAAIVAGDASAIELDKLLKKHRIRVVRNPYQTIGAIGCLGYAWELIDSTNVARVSWILDVIAAAGWHGDKGAYNREWFMALNTIYGEYHEVDGVKETLANYIGQYAPHDIKVDAHTRFPGKSARTAITQIFREVAQKVKDCNDSNVIDMPTYPVQMSLAN